MQTVSACGVAAHVGVKRLSDDFGMATEVRCFGYPLLRRCDAAPATPDAERATAKAPTSRCVRCVLLALGASMASRGRLSEFFDGISPSENIDKPLRCDDPISVTRRFPVFE